MYVAVRKSRCSRSWLTWTPSGRTWWSWRRASSPTFDLKTRYDRDPLSLSIDYFHQSHTDCDIDQWWQILLLKFWTDVLEGLLEQTDAHQHTKNIKSFLMSVFYFTVQHFQIQMFQCVFGFWKCIFNSNTNCCCSASIISNLLLFL